MDHHQFSGPQNPKFTGLNAGHGRAQDIGLQNVQLRQIYTDAGNSESNRMCDGIR